MNLAHPQLVDSLRKAYSAERAASLAYIGHAASLRDPAERAAVRQIEQDEWDHRRQVRAIMDRYAIPVSRWLEFKYLCIGKVIGWSCHVIGRFMPYFFAGKLESGNVCEYFVMIHYFHALGITEHDQILYEMGLKEKEHEVHFLHVIKDAAWLPWFERVFSWGAKSSLNDVNLREKRPLETAASYCRNYPSRSPR
ncbi:MAG: ferritin-like domain-containing protein [Opitutaceae bacterium]|nr:ferritin-like domain-containing protein [Opitutaceae bacterium]MBP9913360.1 ferritin-like domain-containing protein [Opitutaceae bacterium]